MPPKSNVPIRICGSKTRSGCKTCKQRHVKCDETRPVCLKCQRGNRRCTYEASPPRTPPSDRESGSAGSGSKKPLDSLALARVDSSISSISLYGSRHVTEVTAVKYFAAHLGKDLAGRFSNELWCCTLPRVAQHEPAIWNAIVALGSLDSNTRLGYDKDLGNAAISGAVGKYSKAMKELNDRLTSTPDASCKDVVLLSCVLFALFESLQNRFDSALRHISGGIKLLTEWTQQAQSNVHDLSSTYLDRTALLPIFLVLDTQAIQMGPAGFRDFFSSPGFNDQICCPSTFTTLDEAHLMLLRIANRLTHWQIWVEPVSLSASGEHPGEEWVKTEEQNIRECMAQWDSAFEIPMQRFCPDPAILLLLVQRKVGQTIFEMHAYCGPGESEWDRFLPLFQEAVEYAEEYMRLTSYDFSTATGDALLAPRSALSLTMDLVMPMFYTSARCRDPAIRRRALAILKTCGRKEGIWDSRACAEIAESIIEMEEAAMEDGYIPESARVYEVDIVLDEEVGGEVGYKRSVWGEEGSKTTDTIRQTVSVYV